MKPERKISAKIVVRHDTALTRVRTALAPFLDCCQITPLFTPLWLQRHHQSNGIKE